MTTSTSPRVPTRDLTLLALTAVVIFWASAFVGIRAVSDVFDPGPLALGRLAVGALALALIARPWRHRMPRGRTLVLVVVYGIAWFGLYNIALNAAEVTLDAGTTALVVNIGPILIALGAGIFLSEGFPRPLMVGMAISFAGVVLIAASTRDPSGVATTSIVGVVLAVGAALLYAVGALVQKPTLAAVDPSMSVWLACTVGAVVCLPFAPRLTEQLGRADAADVGWLVYLGVFPTAIGFAAWAYASKRLTSGQVASTTYLVPAVTTLISWVLLAEIPAALAFAGGGLCLIGVAVTRWRSRPATGRRSGRPPPWRAL
ncbi:DMT family transporter [Aeromicrobium sp. CTD01-1L150]|uniref:DMT family transporter n=1 Tax=Aeromicrobium sp. CTD01-1L150 TaxID=3341830 RepID=UPI0035C0C1C6